MFIETPEGDSLQESAACAARIRFKSSWLFARFVPKKFVDILQSMALTNADEVIAVLWH